MTLVRRCMLLVALALACAALSGAAQASATTVQATIKAQDKSIAESTTVKRIITTGSFGKISVAKAIKLFTSLQHKLDHAATVVAAASATTATEKTGQTTWVAGTRAVATGLGDFVLAFRAVEHHQKSAATKEAKLAVKTISKGAKTLIKANRELGLPPGS